MTLTTYVKIKVIRWAPVNYMYVFTLPFYKKIIKNRARFYILFGRILYIRSIDSYRSGCIMKVLLFFSACPMSGDIATQTSKSLNSIIILRNVIISGDTVVSRR